MKGCDLVWDIIGEFKINRVERVYNLLTISIKWPGSPNVIETKLAQEYIIWVR